MENTNFFEQRDAIITLDRKRQIVENQMMRILDMKQKTQTGTATRVVMDNSNTVHNSFFVQADTAHRIFDAIYTELTTQREQIMTEAAKLLTPTEQEPVKENETAPANA